MRNLLRPLLAAFLLCCLAATAAAADITITVASFVPSSNAVYYPSAVTGSVAVTAGMAVYLNSSGVWEKAKADASATLVGVSLGLACHASSPGQPLAVLKSDPSLTLGATVAIDGLLVVSGATAGGIALYADLVTGKFINVFGIMKTATTAIVDFPNAKTTTVALP